MCELHASGVEEGCDTVQAAATEYAGQMLSLPQSVLPRTQARPHPRSGSGDGSVSVYEAIFLDLSSFA